MGTVSFTLEAQEAKAVAGFLKLVDAQKKAEQGMEGITRKSRETEKATVGGMDKAAISLAKMATGAAAGVAGFSTLLAVIQRSTEAIKEMHEASARFAKEGVAGQLQIQLLAEQEKLSGAGGLAEAARRVNSLVQRTGATPAVAAEARRAALSLIPDQAVAGQIGELTAGVMAKTGGSVDQVTALTDLLTRIPGATASRAGAAGAIGKMQAAMFASGFSNLGEFALTLGKGGNALFNNGVSLDEALARQAQARSVEPSADRAAELLRQVAVSVGSDPVRKLISGARGVPVGQVSNIPFSERFGIFEKAILDRQNDPAALDALLNEIPGTERQRIKDFFLSRGGRTTLESVRGGLAGVSGDQIEQEIKTFQGTAIAQAAKLGMAEDVRRTAAPLFDQVRGLLYNQAQRRVEEFTQRGAYTGIIAGSEWLANKLVPGRDWEQKKTEDAMALIQLESLGGSAPGGWHPGKAGDAIHRRLAAAKARAGIADDALIGPGGTVVINAPHNGDVYAAPVNRAAGVHPSAPALP